MFQKHGAEMGGMNAPLERQPDAGGGHETNGVENKVETSHHGMVGSVMEAIDKAPDKSIVIVSGLEEHEYKEAEKMKARIQEKGLKVVNRDKGEDVAAVHAQITSDLHPQREGTVVANMPELVKNILQTAPGSHGAAHLIERTGDPMTALNTWIKEVRESGEGETEGNPDAVIEYVLEKIRGFAGQSERDIELILPPNSPLTLALIMLAKYGTLSHSMSDVRDATLDKEKAVRVHIKKHKKARVYIGDREFGEYVE